MSALLPEKILDTVQSPAKYQENLSDIINTISSGSRKNYKIFIDLFIRILKERKFAPPQKLLALELFQACMLLNKPDFIALAQSCVLEYLVTLAQKDSTSLFKDSSHSQENSEACEAFLDRLLRYIYIWANDLGQSNGKSSNDFTKAFYKLREKVTFPDPKPKASISKSFTTSFANISATNKNKKLNLDHILRTVEAVEGMENPYTNENGVELIKFLKKVQKSLDSAYIRAKATGDQNIINKVTSAGERINKVLSSCGISEESKESPIHRSTIRANTKGTEFNDILGLSAGPPQLSNTYSHVNKNPVNSSLGSFLNMPDPPDLEIARLKQEILDKDNAYKALTIQCAFLQSRIKELESQLESQKSLPAPQPPPLPAMSASDNTSRYSHCTASNTLLLTNCIKLTFEATEDESLYLLLTFHNISLQPIKDLEFDIDSAFGFDIQYQELRIDYIQSGDSVKAEFEVKFLCATELVPVMLVSFRENNNEVQHYVNLPITIGRFCRPVLSNPNDLWKEWELLAFDNEACSVPLNLPVSQIQQLIALGENVAIFTAKSIKSIKPQQIFAVFQLIQRIFLLISSSGNSNGLIEVRCESMSLRRTLRLLILNQLS